jgi:large-conductance mechanosensitive channel
MINAVRNTVLAVLNKNNYGYISPQDFNLYAKQAQMEMYEEYFSSYNKVVNAENARMSGTDYADIRKTLSEVIEGFLVKNNLIVNANPTQSILNNFYAPSLTTTGDSAYMINTIITYPVILASGVNSSLGQTVIDNTVDFNQIGVKVGDIVVNLTQTPTTTLNYTSIVTAIVNANELSIAVPYFLIAGESYVIFSAASGVEAEKVNESKIFMLNRSNLTTPSDIFPSYVLNNQVLGSNDAVVTMYPQTINTYGQVVCTYFRYPKDPKWTYVTLFNGEPSFDQSQIDYQDFELPLEDEFKLVMKILQYCGISIREQEVVQFGMAQEQHEQPTFSQQQ